MKCALGKSSTKSAVLFNKNTSSEAKMAVMQALNITQETDNDRYLGLPVHVGQSRTKTFECLKDRVWQHIQGWKEKLLSKASKEVLLRM